MKQSIRGMLTTEMTISLSLQKRWNKKNLNPLSYLPTELKGRGITPEQNKIVNQGFGGKASAYAGGQVDLLPHSPYGLWPKGRSVLYYGYGRGYDRSFIHRVAHRGLHTEIHDISTVACHNAEQYIESHREEWGEFTPTVTVSDVRYFSALPHHDYALIYACRLLGALDDTDLRLTLNGFGRHFLDQDHPVRLVVIEAFSNDNPHVVQGPTMRLRPLSLFADYLQRGSARKIQVLPSKDTISYYHKRYRPVVFIPYY
ncbi:MAG TPA: hypothetical protein VEA59_02550 [Patescibacteria group bacterium]|nr:hypothetical protein [Patescibacteria group bacterium]